MSEVNVVEVIVLFGTEANYHYGTENLVTDEVQEGVHRFEFCSEAEAAAFRLGVEQGIGWQEYSFLTADEADTIAAANPVDPNAEDQADE